MPTKIKPRGWLSTVYLTDFPSPYVNVNSSTVTSVLKVSDTVTTGGSVPDWRQRIAQGKSATTTLVGTKRTLKRSSGYFAVTRPGTPYYGNANGDMLAKGSQYAFPSPDISSDPSADDKAKSKLLDSYIKCQTRWRGGNFIAETVGLITKTESPALHAYKATLTFAKQVNNIVKKFKALKNPKKMAKAISSAWLSFRFVALPAMSDAKEAAEALAEHTLSRKHDTYPVSGKGGRSVYLGQGINSVSYSPVFTGDVTVTRRSTVDYTMEYKGRVIATCNPTENKLENFGMSIFDVPPAAWEAIPWSFFIDYFVNVNEMLDSLRYVNANPAWLNRRVRNVSTFTWESIRVPPSVSGYRQQGGSSKATAVTTTVNRSVMGAMPYPNWHFKMPKKIQTLNILALTDQIYQIAKSAAKKGRG